MHFSKSSSSLLGTKISDGKSDLDLLSRPYAATYVSNASALCSVLLLSFRQLTLYSQDKKFAA